MLEPSERAPGLLLGEGAELPESVELGGNVVIHAGTVIGVGARLQDAAVVGKSFTRAGLGAVTGRPPTDMEAALASLVRKDLLSLQSDPRSPERGQYGFVQDLVRKVAYETLSRRDRQARHLADRPAPRRRRRRDPQSARLPAVRAHPSRAVAERCSRRA